MSPTAEPDLAVVVPTYRRADRIPALLDALAAQTLDLGRFEVVIVDDCSGDGTRDTIAHLAAASPLRCRVRSTPVNGGPAVARNVGWRSTTAPVLAFIDDDCLPAPGWAAAGLATMTADPTLGLVQGHTVAPPGIDVREAPNWSVWRIIDRAGAFFEGCNIFYRRAALEATAGFDEDIAWWGEDTSLGWSVVDAGWGRGFADGALAVHEVDLRGWWWYVVNGWAERNVVRLAAEHPGFRAEAFWRPWAFRRDDGAFAIALAGLVAGLRWRPGLLAAVPYLWWRRPSVRHLSFFRLCLQIPTVDLARAAGQIEGAIRHRVAVL